MLLIAENITDRINLLTRFKYKYQKNQHYQLLRHKKGHNLIILNLKYMHHSLNIQFISSCEES